MNEAKPARYLPGVCPVCDFIGGHAADCEQLATRGTTRAAEVAAEADRIAARESGADHVLRCWPESFEALLDGTKPFEVRKDDRGGYRVGHLLRLREFIPQPCGPGLSVGNYTGRELLARCTYVLGGAFGIKRGFVVMGVEVESVNGKRWERPGGLASARKAVP